MGRIKENILIEDKPVWTIFDSGAQNSYVLKSVVNGVTVNKLKQSRTVRLGGSIHKISENCIINCVIDGFNAEVLASIVEYIGVDEDRKGIECIIGALAMQQWNIKLNMKDEKLDLSHFQEEFTEF